MCHVPVHVHVHVPCACACAMCMCMCDRGLIDPNTADRIPIDSIAHPLHKSSVHGARTRRRAKKIGERSAYKMAAEHACVCANQHVCPRALGTEPRAPAATMLARAGAGCYIRVVCMAHAHDATPENWRALRVQIGRGACTCVCTQPCACARVRESDRTTVAAQARAGPSVNKSSLHST